MTRKSAAGPPRRARQVVARPHVFILVEGKKTEGSYLLAYQRSLQDRVLVTIDEQGGAPMTLVERAVKVTRAGALEERKGRGRAYDSVWCVFDRDEHPNIDNALRLAAANGINVAFSDPCLELWFLLHFQPQTAGLHRDEAQLLSRAYLKCDKTLNAAASASLSKRHDLACGRAQALDAKHAGDGSPPRSNPSSDMWRLIEELGTITSR